jgi:hypothetical protein
VVNRLGGYSVNFFKTFYRQAAPPSAANIKSFSDSAANGRPDQKITSLSLLEKFVTEIRSAKVAPENARQDVASMMEIIHHSRLDPLPAVAAWACKCEAELVDAREFESIIRDMVEDQDWRHRQLAVMMLDGLDPKVRDELAAKLATDLQGSVRQDATVVQAMVTLPVPAPTTMPTTAPTTVPTTLPDLTPLAP